MSKQRATEQDVMEFIKAICPEAPNLYLASFSEKQALQDATCLIHDLEARVSELQVFKQLAEEHRLESIMVRTANAKLQARVVRLQDTLEWYAGKARALVRYAAQGRTDAQEGVSLDTSTAPAYGMTEEPV